MDYLVDRNLGYDTLCELCQKDIQLKLFSEIESVTGKIRSAKRLIKEMLNMDGRVLGLAVGGT